MKIGDIVVVLYESRRYYIVVAEERAGWFYVLGDTGHVRCVPQGELKLINECG